jgi:hypothetical protein
MVADAEAERSIYAAAQTGDSGAESSALLATMLLAQTKQANDAAAATSATGTSAYNKRNTISMLGAIA